MHEIDQKIEEDDQHSNEQSDALYQRVIAISNCLEEESADSGDREDLLQNDHARYEEGELDSRERDHRKKRVAKQVPPNYQRLA